MRLLRFIFAMSLFSHDSEKHRISAITLRNIGYHSSSAHVDRIVSNRVDPLYSPVIAHSPIDWRVGAADPHAGIYNLPFSSVKDLGLV